MLTDELFYGTKVYHKDLAELCKPLEKYFGINQAAYLNIDKNGGLVNVHTHSKWMERCMEQHYYKLDPHMVHPDNIHNGFTLVTTSKDQDYKNIMLNEAIHKFDLHHSIAYVEKNKSSCTVFSFSSHKDNYQIINNLLNEMPLFKKIIRHLNKQIIEAFPDLRENKVNFSKLKGDAFYKQIGLVFKEPKENCKKIKMLQDDGFVDDDYADLAQVKLSPQEINCLRIYMENDNTKYVAKNLNIAISTVISHIENAKQKLYCSNKQQLLEKAEFLVGLGKI